MKKVLVADTVPERCTAMLKDAGFEVVYRPGLSVEELKEAEQIYRNSTPDITHNHVRLLYSPKLWSTMLDSAVTGWKVRNLTDTEHEASLRRSKAGTLLFFVIGLIPFLGKVLRRLWARPDWRRHYGSMLTSFDYLKRATKARIIEKTIAWPQGGHSVYFRDPAGNSLEVASPLIWHIDESAVADP